VVCEQPPAPSGVDGYVLAHLRTLAGRLLGCFGISNHTWQHSGGEVVAGKSALQQLSDGVTTSVSVLKKPNSSVLTSRTPVPLSQRTMLDAIKPFAVLC
jgi:hypothetical protein